jgi:hypothetical protein
MPFHYKAFVLVMAITAVMFFLAKPLFTRFMSPEDFSLRRNVWVALTVAAFLIPNYWAYTLVALVVVGFAATKDSNPAALYMFLLLVLPPLRETIPGIGFKQLFAIDHLRLLSLMVLIPLALRMRAAPGSGSLPNWPDGSSRARLQAPDIFLLLYAVLQLVLMFPYESFTASVRRVMLLGMDMLLPYFIISRACRSRAALIDCMAGFALAMCVLAPLAWVEFARGWILYAGLEERWGTGRMISYLTRGDNLRAQVTGGHSIVFGFAMMVGFGFWLYLQTRVDSAKWRWLGLLTILGGLVATLARGPWVGAAAILLVFLALGPHAGRRTVKALGGMAVVGGIVLMTPWGSNIIDHLPFVGTVGDESITYRARLAEMSWMLIQQNPLLGTPYYMAYMEELRQGEGIIDIVNTYAGLALTYGLVGLGLFAGFFVATLLRAHRVIRASSDGDPDFSLLGAALVACIVGALITIATVSNYLSVPYVYWALAGLAFAYVQVWRTSTDGWVSLAPVADAAGAWQAEPQASPAYAGRLSRLLREDAARRMP